MTSIRERNKRLILRAASEEFADNLGVEVSN
ncbi:hypothetical protein ACLBUQ_33400, partial [Pseudomonas aeruginosa]